MEARVGRLRLVADVLKIIAWVVLASGVLVGLVALAALILGTVFGAPTAIIQARATIFGGISSLIMALIWFALLYGAAELIRLVMEIEAQARQLARRLDERDERL